MKTTNSDLQKEVAQVFINDALSRVEFSAKQVLAAVSEGDALRTQLAALRRLVRWTPVNTVKARQRIADYVIDAGKYAL
jgi:hypothetical protein